ncbi:MAG TPA: FmdB family zinc ribbon protein [Candidatus Elarobacter sp.]|nr:FmdB family zinc ribbon protein [Candidatus Elarobacter sp.]
MPLYDYRCRACSKLTEVRHAFREAHTGACPECGGELARVFSPAGIVFKGSGFYLTDSRKASETAKAAASKSSSEPAKPAETTTSEPAATTTAPASAPAATATAPAPSSGGDAAPKKSESSAA